MRRGRHWLNAGIDFVGGVGGVRAHADIVHHRSYRIERRRGANRRRQGNMKSDDSDVAVVAVVVAVAGLLLAVEGAVAVAACLSDCYGGGGDCGRDIGDYYGVLWQRIAGSLNLQANWNKAMYAGHRTTSC